MALQTRLLCDFGDGLAGASYDYDEDTLAIVTVDTYNMSDQSMAIGLIADDQSTLWAQVVVPDGTAPGEGEFSSGESDVSDQGWSMALVSGPHGQMVLRPPFGVEANWPA